MKITSNVFIYSTFIGTTIMLCTGCDSRKDHISNAKHADTNVEVALPSIEETQSIAEAGYIYGLPIVMNYAVVYEYAVDKNSGQFKAPFNQISNDGSVFIPNVIEKSV